MLTINVCGRAYRDPVCGFLVFSLQITIEPFALLHHSAFYYYMCFTFRFHRWGRATYAHQTYICTLELLHNLEWGYARINQFKFHPLSPRPAPATLTNTHTPTHTPAVVFLLTVPRRFFCCSSSLVWYVAFVLSLFHWCFHLYLNTEQTFTDTFDHRTKLVLRRSFGGIMNLSIPTMWLCTDLYLMVFPHPSHKQTF